MRTSRSNGRCSAFRAMRLFLSLALAIDMGKSQRRRFGTQILLEVLGGFSFGLAFLCLQLGCSSRSCASACTMPRR